MGKFLSVDPLTSEYPELTPYQFASNRPIDGIDLDGLEPTYYMNAWGGLSKHPTIAGPYAEELLNRYGLFSQSQYQKYQYEKQLRASLSSAPQGPTMRAKEYTDGSAHTLPIARGLVDVGPLIGEELLELPMLAVYTVGGAISGRLY